MNPEFRRPRILKISIDLNTQLICWVFCFDRLNGKEQLIPIELNKPDRRKEEKMEKGTCKMGWYVRNAVSGYEGFVIGKLYWMYGCELILLMPTKEPQSILDFASEREKIAEEFLEKIEDRDNMRFEKEFVRPDLDKYFGMLCRDKVTGFEGVAIGCATSMHGSDQYALQPLVRKKNKIEGPHEWIDVGRLEVIRRQVAVEEVQSNRPGGCELNLTDDLLMALS